MHNYNKVVYVDADACPVKDEIEEICHKYNIQIVYVASYSHFLQPKEGVEIVMVDNRKEEADLYIVNHCQRGDIVVTQDHGLAAILLPKQVSVLSPRGKRFSNEIIEELLLARHLGQKSRRAGLKTKGPSKLTNSDKLNFCKEFEKILSHKEGI